MTKRKRTHKKKEKKNIAWDLSNVLNTLKVSSRGEDSQREKFKNMLVESLQWYKENYKDDKVFWSLIRGGKNWHLCLCNETSIIARIAISYTPEKKSMSKICTNVRRVFDILCDKQK